MTAWIILAYLARAILCAVSGFALGWIIMGAMLHGLT